MSGPTPDQPVRVPVSAQRWESMTFLHWAYDAAAVQRLLPDGLAVETWDGRASVGVLPFEMVDVRVPPLPALPGWSRFLEVNVRTYVHHPASGRDGVWFFTLLCPRRAFVAAMRVPGVPYRRAPGVVRARADDVRYACAVPGGGRFEAAVRPGPVLEDPGDRLHSLTGRWAAFVSRAGQLWRVPVEHATWPLHAATVTHLRADDLLASVGLPAPDGPPEVAWSPGVEARIGMTRPA